MSPSPTDDRPQLTAAQAVALSLLADDHRADQIQRRTGVESHELYPLAAAWQVTPACGTAEGAEVRLARGEKPCTKCLTAKGIADSRAAARRRRKEAKQDAQRTLVRGPRRRGATAATGSRRAGSGRPVPSGRA
ncbi:hypothetical protein ACFV3E_36590 [Streptomyces sp. NPDC059718]